MEVERKGAIDPSFRLSLRLEDEERFELIATDPFGRALWKIEVDRGTGRFLDERQRWACRFDPAASNAMPRLDWGLTALELPAVLRGALPGSAVSEGVGMEAGSFEFRDARGRLWTGEADARGLASWRMETADGALTYRREGVGATLSDDRSGARLRWRELAAEPLSGPLQPLSAGTPELPECADADLS